VSFRRAAALAALALFALGGQASADRGVAVDLGLIEIDRPLQPGGTYRLPILGVRNPGDVPGRYLMGVGQTGTAGTAEPALEWFTFSPSGFELEPGQRVQVSISMRLPPDVEPGAYEGLVRAELMPEEEGAVVGAAAAARLTFEVQPSSSIDAYLRGALDFLAGLPTWIYLIPAGLLALVALRLASRRFTFRVERRP
jgi:hypothetical protein